MIDLEGIRSLLFLPASNPRAIEKARSSGADLVVLDLEDAVKREHKDTARAAAVAAVAGDWPMPVAIRVNGIDSEWFAEDVEAVAGSHAGLAILPRADASDAVRTVRERLERPLLAMIETASGVLAAPEIAKDATALIAGTNDLRADLRLPLNAPRASIAAALQWIVLAARSGGIPAFDGVFNDLVDLAGFDCECAEGRTLGFAGKSLIHPAQIDPCNRAFSPTDDEIAEARALVEAFSGGAVRFNDRMIERMHVEAARRILVRAGHPSRN